MDFTHNNNIDFSIITNNYLKDIIHIKGHNCKDIFTNFYSNVDR